MRNDFFKHILLSSGSRQNRIELETETLPYTFNSNSYKLRNYRIYGNTVNGESVGNLQENGKYLVPVTVSGNLFDENYLVNVKCSSCTVFISNHIITLTVTNIDPFFGDVLLASQKYSAELGQKILCSAGQTYYVTISDNRINKNYVTFIDESEMAVSFIKFTTNSFSFTVPLDAKYMFFRIGKQEAVAGDVYQFTVSVTKFPMLNYEPYHEPITANIYLSEPLRKIGNELEYIDFREQKQHSKKNLWNIELVKGSFNITDGKPTIVQNRVRSKNNDYFLPAGTYTLNANGASDCVVYRYSTQSTDDYALSESVTAWQSLPYTFTTSEGFYTMFGFRRSDNANIEPSDVTDIQLEKGSTATDYEAPNESVELDISLPALPTLSGTNTLSVGTTVQPSKLYIQGNISEIETVSAETQALQANIQNLQPLSLDENAETDVMPSDNLQLDVINPKSDLNSIGGDDSAE